MKALDIPVANVPGGSNSALAEYALACALVLLRRIRWADRQISHGEYSAARARMLASNVTGLEGLTVGVVGLGNVGMAVAGAFKRMGSRIVYCDPGVADQVAAAELGARPLSLFDLLADADVVTLHVPLAAATRNMIGAAELAVMKRSAILINAARGGVVDEQALANGLMRGEIGGAAVDVYTEEPPLETHPLLSLKGEAAERAAPHAPHRRRHAPGLRESLQQCMGQRGTRRATRRATHAPRLLAYRFMRGNECRSVTA